MKTMNLMRRALLIGGAVMAVAAGIPGADAATVTNTFQVRITLTNACDVTTTAPTTLDFGSHGLLSANVDQTSTITVTCTSGAAYNIGLDGGGAADINARVMANGTDHVGYQLYQPSGYTTVWGNTVGTDTVSSTGTGTAQTFTVNGRVPPQTTPPAATYTDTITVTVTY